MILYLFENRRQCIQVDEAFEKYDIGNQKYKKCFVSSM